MPAPFSLARDRACGGGLPSGLHPKLVLYWDGEFFSSTLLKVAAFASLVVHETRVARKHGAAVSCGKRCARSTPSGMMLRDISEIRGDYSTYACEEVILYFSGDLWC